MCFDHFLLLLLFNKNTMSTKKLTLATAAARQPLINMYVGVISPGGFAIELSRIPYAKYEPPANGITPEKNKAKHSMTNTVAYSLVEIIISLLTIYNGKPKCPVAKI